MINKLNRTRRQFIGSALGVVGAGVVGAAGLGAIPGRDQRALGLDPVQPGRASATQRAVRLDRAGREGSLTFPVDTTDGDLVMPNGFGGTSDVNGESGHRGVDIGNGCSNGRGRPLLACVDGFLDSEKVLSSAGMLRILSDGLGNYYRYHHLEEYEPTVQVGDAVTRGQVIGYMGTTGNTLWPHLHFEVWIGGISSQLGGEAVDPEPLLPWPIDGVTKGQPDC